MEKMTGIQQDMRMIEEVLKEREKEPPGDMEDIMSKAVVAAIIVGLLVTGYFVFAVKESYSALYIKPDSYSNYVVNNTISFIYGVRCFEGEDTTYTAEIYLNNASIGENTFTLEPGKEKEWQVSTDIPGYMQYPVKVRVQLESPQKTYETHYWLKGSKK